MQEQLVPFAAVSLVVYTVGIPATFGYILFRHATAIRADQELLVLGMGNNMQTNSSFVLRKRYQELYNLFKPGMAWWRLLLIVRKFLLVAVGMMFSTNPLFQAW